MIKWNEYTWYSKLGAILLFVLVIPILAFIIGMQYQKTVDVVGSPEANSSVTDSSDATTVTGSYANNNGGATNGAPGTVAPKPTISSLTPSSGPAGNTIGIVGTNFDITNYNSITFGNSSNRFRPDGLPDNVFTTAKSSDGLHLNFVIPSQTLGGQLCDTNHQCVGITPVKFPPGVYNITVVNGYGVSNSMPFTLTQ